MLHFKRFSLAFLLLLCLQYGSALAQDNIKWVDIPVTEFNFKNLRNGFDAKHIAVIYYAYNFANRNITRGVDYTALTMSVVLSQDTLRSFINRDQYNGLSFKEKAYIIDHEKAHLIIQLLQFKKLQDTFSKTVFTRAQEKEIKQIVRENLRQTIQLQNEFDKKTSTENLFNYGNLEKYKTQLLADLNAAYPNGVIEWELPLEIKLKNIDDKPIPAFLSTATTRENITVDLSANKWEISEKVPQQSLSNENQYLVFENKNEKDGFYGSLPFIFDHKKDFKISMDFKAELFDEKRIDSTYISIYFAADSITNQNNCVQLQYLNDAYLMYCYGKSRKNHKRCVHKPFDTDFNFGDTRNLTIYKKGETIYVCINNQLLVTHKIQTPENINSIAFYVPPQTRLSVKDYRFAYL